MSRVKHDWTTTDGVTAGLQGRLELEGHGSTFQMYRGDTPIPLAEARQLVIEVIVSPDMMGRYQTALRRMSDAGDNVDNYVPYVQSVPDGLVFEHGDFREAISLSGDVQVVGPAAGCSAPEGP